jgi:hypothetical protein
MTYKYEGSRRIEGAAAIFGFTTIFQFYIKSRKLTTVLYDLFLSRRGQPRTRYTGATPSAGDTPANSGK